MKSFAAALFATAFLAGDAEAANSKSWTGTAADLAGKNVTPSGSSSWSISSSQLTATYTGTATLSKDTLIKDEKVQTWWCMPNAGKNTCMLWQWEYKPSDTLSTMKSYVFTSKTAANPSPEANKNSKDDFDTSSAWTKDASTEYTKKGTAALTKVASTDGSNGYKFGTASYSGKVAKGTMTKTFTTEETKTVRKGQNFSGRIGVYYKNKDGDKKTTQKDVQTGHAAEVVAKATVATGSNKKTWTGTAVTSSGKILTPSAMSDWAIDTTSKMMTVSYKTMATLTTGTLENKEEQQVWWCALDIEASKTHCTMWAFQYDSEKKEQTMKARVFHAPTATGLPTPKVDENVKDWFGKSTSGWTQDSAYEYEKEGTGALTKKDGDEKSLAYKWSTASISGTVATGTLTKTHDATVSTTLKKGKLYTGVIGAYYQTVTAAGASVKKTSRKEMQVGIAAEGKGAAASLFTTLGAIAVGVVALAF